VGGARANAGGGESEAAGSIPVVAGAIACRVLCLACACFHFPARQHHAQPLQHPTARTRCGCASAARVGSALQRREIAEGGGSLLSTTTATQRVPCESSALGCPRASGSGTTVVSGSRVRKAPSECTRCGALARQARGRTSGAHVRTQGCNHLARSGSDAACNS
jgi:hypothetical protein